MSELNIASENISQVNTIDLTSPQPGAINIGKQWKIFFPTPPKVFGIDRKISKDVFLHIRNIQCPSEWIVDGKKLFSASFEDQQSCLNEQDGLKIHLSKVDTYFQLFLNEGSITDCNEKQSFPAKSYAVKFELYICNEKGKEIVSVPQTVAVQFNEVHASPCIQVVIDNKYRELTFDNKLREEKIGHIRVSNPAPKNYFNAIEGSLSFVVKCAGKEVPGGQFSLDFTRCKGKGVSDYSDNGSFSFPKLGNSAADYIEIPIKANFPAIGNPYNCKDKQAFSLEVSGKYNPVGYKDRLFQVPTVEETMNLIPDLSSPKLLVEIENRNIREELIANNRFETTRVEFLPNNGFRYDNVLVISNVATNGKPNSGIIIHSIKHAVTLYPQNSKIVFSDSRLTNEDVFALSGSNYQKICNGPILLASKPNNAIKMNLGFSDNQIKQIICQSISGKRYFEIRVSVAVTIQYSLDEYGAGISALPAESNKTFTTTIDIPIYQQPYPNWLGIDFGTSAIVSQYKDRLLDLKAKKCELTKGEEDSYEVDSKFLSSNVILQYNASKKDNASQLMSDFDDDIPGVDSLAVRLSPTSEREQQNSTYILPCLKLIMGYQTLPNIAFYKDMKYYRRGVDAIIEEPIVVVPENGDPEYGLLSHVDVVFEDVYRQLLQYYIKPLIPQSEVAKVNQLVFTIPNTYSPIHIQTLRQIITKCFSQFDIRNIKFVSESDAVACYYQSHWAELNQYINRDDVLLKEIRHDERVLVFDMGAGTLDVTLFHLHDRNKKRYITVDGKIGLSMAGNYLDTLIAEIIANKYSANELLNPTIGDDLKSALNLKNYIKQTVKPALSSGEDLILSKDVIKNQDLGLGKSDIEVELVALVKNNDSYKQYIHSVTDVFLDNFFQFFGFEETDAIIDTVITSGRSVKLKDIQDGLERALVKWCKPSYKRIDLSDPIFTKEYDLSKTVVVSGAIDYASLFGNKNSELILEGKNIIANYGIIYKDMTGEELYVELLNSRTTPIEETLSVDGMTINTYNTKPVQVNLSSTNEVTLIQTFSANTQDDWRQHRREYITEMACYNVQHISNAELSIIVDEENALKLCINGAQTNPHAPSKVDLSNRSNQMSLWPVINNNK